MEYKAPQAPVRFPAEPETLLEHTRQAINASRQAQDDIVHRIKPEDATFENVMLPLMHADNVYENQFFMLRHPKDLTSDTSLREATYQVEKITNTYSIESGTREDVFRLVKAVVDRGEQLEEGRSRCLQKVYRSYLNQGLGLDGEKREQFKQIKIRIKELSAECRKNFAGERGGLWLTQDELTGLPSHSLGQLKKGSGENKDKLWLTFKPADFGAAMRFIKDGDIRKKYFIAYENKCNNNAVLVKELYEMRDSAARMLGYANNAAFKIEDSFAQTPSFVENFLDDLQARLKPAGQETIEALLDLKKAELGVSSSNLYLWDTDYYTRLLKQKKHQVDEALESEYLPLVHVLQSQFEIFSTVFGISFVKIELTTDITNGTAHLLHEETQAYQVWNGVKPGNEFIGYLYLDLHARDFKLPHSCHFGLNRGYTKPDGSRHYPSSVLICNWPKPLPEKPSLLRHRECVSTFHELGHAIHNLVSKTEFATLHGTKVAHDFVEAPSRMLENWFWAPEILRSISKHWSHLEDRYAQAWRAEQGPSNTSLELPPEKMPEEMVRRIIDARYTGVALTELRQISLTKFDLEVHSPLSHEDIKQLDPQKLYNSLRHEITGIEGPDNDYVWGNNHARFSHLWGKYDAGYYAYLLANAIAADMYQAFKKDPLSSAQGARYRKQVLEPGASQPEMNLLESFLGRKPDFEPWMKQMGLATAGSV